MRSALVLAAVIACNAPSYPTVSQHVTEYRGGRWFDGHAFVARAMWVVGARFAEASPGHVDEVVDLAGGFVVPPYADGHNHWLEPSRFDAYIQTYLRDGIFYVKDQSTAPAFHDALRPRVNLPGSVDYVAAHQGFTGPRGHPIELVDGLASLGILPASLAETHGEGELLFQVETEADVDRAWPRLIAGRPDFVKVFLVHSDEYAARRDDAARSPKERGLDPALVPAIVARAHRDHLRVSAHIEDAADFHVAIAAGVDEIAHLPFVEADRPERFRLADADLRAAATRGVPIATTLDWASGAKPDDPRLEVVRDNLARMRAAGDTIVIGTDLFRTTARVETDLIASLHLMSNAELLVAWCETTPRSIFPARRLGRLADGFDASFLVLGGDPLLDWANSHDIKLRVKQGHAITPGAATLPPLAD
jgi:hypothetical protein